MEIRSIPCGLPGLFDEYSVDHVIAGGIAVSAAPKEMGAKGEEPCQHVF